MASEPLELLPDADPLTGGEFVYVVQNGSSRKTTIAGLGVTGGGGGGGGTPGTGKYMRTFRPQEVELPATAFAELYSRNSRPVLAFDDTAIEAVVWADVLSPDYAGGGLVVDLFAAMDTATAGTLGWDVAIERVDAGGLDIDSDAFMATPVVAPAVAVPGTAGATHKFSVTLTAGAEMDGLLAGELYRIRIRRDVTDDTAAGDAHLLMVQVREA